jgi:hypothetical protein
MKQLLGPLLGHLSPSHAAYVSGRQFFPHLITSPFHTGLGVAFAFAIAANVLAAVASLLTGRARRGRDAPAAGAGPAESLGEELAAVAAEGGSDMAEIVGTDAAGPESEQAGKPDAPGVRSDLRERRSRP